MNRDVELPDPFDDDDHAENGVRRIVALAIACREDGGDAAVAAILAEYPELADLVRRRMAILADLGLLDPNGVRFRNTGCF
jgi:hypothetical protein